VALVSGARFRRLGPFAHLLSAHTHGVKIQANVPQLTDELQSLEAGQAAVGLESPHRVLVFLNFNLYTG
jgi:hypothetical protein